MRANQRPSIYTEPGTPPLDIEPVGIIPGEDADGSIAIAGENPMEGLLGCRGIRPFGSKEGCDCEVVASMAAFVTLAAMDSQTRHAAAEGQLLHAWVVFDVANEVEEGPSSANRWELPVIADKDQTVASFKSVKEGCEHVLGEH
jgi:hypothetical protein